MKNLSDRELYALCKKWGVAALEARRRFAGLLPEVLRRRLFERRGFGSIYEFAARLAGMSREQVNQSLRLDEKLADFPDLKKLFSDGEVSANKLERVVSVVNENNQQEIVDKVRKLSQRAIEIYVREVKNAWEDDGNMKVCNEQVGLFEGRERLHVQEFKGKQRGGVNVNRDMKLMEVLSSEIKGKLLKLVEQGHDINEVLSELLVDREAKIERDMVIVSDELSQKVVSRHVPVKVVKLVRQKYGEKCSVEGCQRSADHLHHERQFLKWRSHDPRFLRPLCRAHHELVHEGWKIPK